MSVLTLGGFAFSEWELPEEISLPNKQAVKIHKLPGGTRIIDAMGPDPGQITWSGKFRRAEALGRMQMLAAMTNSGQKQELNVLGLSYSVIIVDFTPKPGRGGLEIPYTISCEVVKDNSTSASPALTPLDTLVSGFATAGAAQLAPTPTLVSLALPPSPKRIAA